MRPDKLEINQGKFKVLHVVKEIKDKDTGRQEVQGKQAMAAEIEISMSNQLSKYNNVDLWNTAVSICTSMAVRKMKREKNPLKNIAISSKYQFSKTFNQTEAWAIRWVGWQWPLGSPGEILKKYQDEWDRSDHVNMILYSIPYSWKKNISYQGQTDTAHTVDQKTQPSDSQGCAKVESSW